jgi:hypothetical protein
MEKPGGEEEGLAMDITYRPDSTLGAGTFIRVLRGGHPFGRIYDTVGVYRFYSGEEEKLGGADLHDDDLDRLKAAIVGRYGQTREAL